MCIKFKLWSIIAVEDRYHTKYFAILLTMMIYIMMGIDHSFFFLFSFRFFWIYTHENMLRKRIFGWNAKNNNEQGNGKEKFESELIIIILWSIFISYNCYSLRLGGYRRTTIFCIHSANHNVSSNWVLIF